MIRLLILASALSMDSFAVSISLGSKYKTKLTSLALMTGLYFCICQTIMPLIGYAIGKETIGFFSRYVPFISCFLLVIIGGKMLYEAWSQDVDEPVVKITHMRILMLAIATSIDAIAAGFTLTTLPFNPLFSCLVIGIATFNFSWCGVWTGRVFGDWLENKAEILGGIVLILLGFSSLIT